MHVVKGDLVYMVKVKGKVKVKAKDMFRAPAKNLFWLRLRGRDRRSFQCPAIRGTCGTFCASGRQCLGRQMAVGKGAQGDAQEQRRQHVKNDQTHPTHSSI